MWSFKKKRKGVVRFVDETVIREFKEYDKGVWISYAFGAAGIIIVDNNGKIIGSPNYVKSVQFLNQIKEN
jgi:hypothetical protein